MTELAPEEAEAFRAHRRAQYAADHEHKRSINRLGYHRRMATPEGRAKEREKWHRQQGRLAQRPPNKRLRAAREQAGLSQEALAELLGVGQSAVSKWERYSITPKDAELRERVEELLGEEIWCLG